MSSVQEFYSNQTVFLTGATGFVGKLIVEKLLRSCPKLEKIYILVRPKPGRNLDQRRKEIFSAAFDRLKTEHPEFLEKVHFLSGDCSQPVLGLSPEDVEILKNEVTCIIHSAANVRFDTDLRTAAYTNVRSVRDILDLVKDMEKIKAFVHVSTAFSHCLRHEIAEEFYDVDIAPEKLLRMVEIIDDKILDVVTPSLLGDCPNTYVYTKALAEELIRNYKQVLPVAIVRPSIVTLSEREPVPGWIDHFHGAVGVILGCSLGVLRSLPMDVKCIAPLVPVDHVVNGIITAAWSVQKLEQDTNGDNIPIYNIVPHRDNSPTWGCLINNFKKFTFVYPLSNAVWYHYVQTSRFKTVHRIRVFFYHTLFAYFVDSILFIAGKRTLAVEKYRKINKLVDVLSFFTTNNWDFHCENAQNLWKKLDESERKVFNFNTKAIDWSEYFHTCIVGGRTLLLKDPLETVPKAKRKMHLLRVVHYFFVGLVFYLWYIIISHVFRLFYKF